MWETMKGVADEISQKYSLVIRELAEVRFQMIALFQDCSSWILSQLFAAGAETFPCLHVVLWNMFWFCMSLSPSVVQFFPFFFFFLLFHALYFCWIVIKWLVGQLNFNNVSFDCNNLKLSVLTGLMQKVIISLCSGTVKKPLESCVKRCLPKVKAIHRHCSFMLLAAVGCANFALYAWAKLTDYTWLWEKMKDLFLWAPAASALSHWWLWPDRIAISVSPLALLFDQWAPLSCSGIRCTSQPQLISLDLRSFFLELVLSSGAVSSGLYQRLLLSHLPLKALLAAAPTHSASGSASCGRQR